MKQIKISNFMISPKNKSLDEILARMTSVDNIPMSKFKSSTDLRDLFKGNGFNLPSSAHTIKQHAMKYHKEVQRTIISELNELKSNCNKFSLIFAEWTSTSNKLDFT